MTRHGGKYRKQSSGDAGHEKQPFHPPDSHEAWWRAVGTRKHARPVLGKFTGGGSVNVSSGREA